MTRAMKRALAACLLAASAFSHAQADLAKEKSCMACHALTARIVGPAFKDVATKYRGQKDAEEQLVQKVIKGSAGAWGPVPMPPNPRVTEPEARSLVKWVLSQQ